MNTINLEGALEGTSFAAVGGYTVPNIISTGIQLMLIAAAVGAFIYLLMGAFSWITSGGNKEGTENARKKITGALIGLAITFSVYVLQSIIGIVFLGDGNAIFNFKIPTLDKIPVSTSPATTIPAVTGGTAKCDGYAENTYSWGPGSKCFKCISQESKCSGVKGANTGWTGFWCRVDMLETPEPLNGKCPPNK